MRISIVVPAFNEERLLQDSLRSIRAAMRIFAQRGWTAELIVCDNNSTDRTGEIAAEAGAVVVFEAINQIARARNTGAAHANGDWIIFVDADSQPSPELFGEVADAISAGRCVAGGCVLRLDGDRSALTLVTRVLNLCLRLNNWAAGAFIFCEARVFREIGGFSPALFAGEEIDLFRRLKKLARHRGRTIRILHRHPLRTSDRKLRLYGPREMITFMARTLIGRGRTLLSSEACFPWYDGRR